MLKKTIIIALFVLIVIAYAQNIFWGDGLNILKGNYLFYYESVKTSNDEVVVCWSEADNINRTIKMQKILNNDELAWENPLTIIDENLPTLCHEIVESSDGNIFVQTKNSFEPDINRIYKISNQGEMLWSEEIDPDNNYLNGTIADDNGGIYLLYRHYEDGLNTIVTNHIYHDGISLQHNEITLYSAEVSCGLDYYDLKIMNNNLYLFFESNDLFYVHLYDENGNEIWDEPIQIGEIIYGKPIIKYFQNKIYTLWKNSAIYLQAFDESGISLNAGEPILIHNDTGFRKDLILKDETLNILICDYGQTSNIHYYNIASNGEIINSSDYSIPLISYPPSAFIDEDRDFIISKNSDGGSQYHYVAYEILENSIDMNPVQIDDITENTYFRNIYFNNEKFVLLSNPANYEDLYYKTSSATGLDIETRLIRKVINYVKDADLYLVDDALAFFWTGKGDNHKLYQNIISSDGVIQYDNNGFEIVDLDGKYNCKQHICGDKSVVVTSEYDDEYEINTSFFQEFNLEGLPITEEIFFNESVDIADIGIITGDNSFYYIYKTYPNEENFQDITSIYKIQNGSFCWEEPIILEGYLGGIINDLIIYSSSIWPGNDIYCTTFDENGILENTTEICTSTYYPQLYIYDHFSNTVVAWKTNYDADIQILNENGEPIWENPLELEGFNEIIAEDNRITILHNSFNSSIEFSAYDFEKNLLEEHCFEIECDEMITDFAIEKINDLFVIVAVVRYSSNDREIQYSVIDELGNTLFDFCEDTFCNVEFPSEIDQIIKKDQVLYILFHNKFYAYDCESEKNYFIQKMDFTDFTNSDNNNLIKPVLTTIAYPNPFNPTINISYNLPNDSKVSLEIFNIKGQKIKTILSENQKSGNHRTIWQGKDENEKKVSSGIYFYKLKTDQNEKIKKIILMK